MGDPFSTGEKRMMRKDPNVRYDPLDVRPLCKRLREAGVEVHDTNIDYDHVVETKFPRLAGDRRTDQGGDRHRRSARRPPQDRPGRRQGRVLRRCSTSARSTCIHGAFDPARLIVAPRRSAWRERRESPSPGGSGTTASRASRDRMAVDARGSTSTRASSSMAGRSTTRCPALDGSAARRGRARSRSARVHTATSPMRSRTRCSTLYLAQHRRGTSRSIFIENPYLYHPTLVEALCAARRSARPSLRVTLVLPARRHNDNQFGQDAQEYYYARYLACGIEVWEYQHHFNHFKLAVFDERFSIHGSTNLNFRSLEIGQGLRARRARGRRVVRSHRSSRDSRDVDISHALRITDRGRSRQDMARPLSPPPQTHGPWRCSGAKSSEAPGYTIQSRSLARTDRVPRRLSCGWSPRTPCPSGAPALDLGFGSLPQEISRLGDLPLRIVSPWACVPLERVPLGRLRRGARGRGRGFSEARLGRAAAAARRWGRARARSGSSCSSCSSSGGLPSA